MRIYVDTSAAAKLLADERETAALEAFLTDATEAQLISSMLLETELRRTASRKAVPQTHATAILSGIDLIDLPRAVFQQAGLLGAPDLRSLDALHLASAMHADCSALLAYDRRLLDAAASLGLPTIAPA